MSTTTPPTTARTPAPQTPITLDSRDRLNLKPFSPRHRAFTVKQDERTGRITLDPVVTISMQDFYDNDPELQEAIAYARTLPTKPVVRDPNRASLQS